MTSSMGNVDPHFFDHFKNSLKRRALLKIGGLKMIHILLSLGPIFRGGAVSCSVFFCLFAGDSLWQIYSVVVPWICVFWGDLSMLSTMGFNTSWGIFFCTSKFSSGNCFFLVILWPGDFGTLMRDAKRPASLPRNYHSWFQWSVPVGGFWMNCSFLRAKPHKYVWHFIVEEHFNWCFCCWWAKFNAAWLSSKLRW